jgi:hypothetical protein
MKNLFKQKNKKSSQSWNSQKNYKGFLNPLKTIFKQIIKIGVGCLK